MNISELIKIDLDSERKKRSERIRSGRYSPSSFGRCFRAQFWNRKNEPISNPPDDRAMRIFSCGDIFHDWIQEKLRKVNPDIQCEVKIERENYIGFADIVNGDEVIDIKTMHSKAFWYLDKCIDIKKEKYSNWLQVMWYAICLGKKYGKLCFVSKDDLCINEYREEANDYWKTEISKETCALDCIWMKGELPKAEPRAWKTECAYCNWEKKCKEIEKAS